MHIIKPVASAGLILLVLSISVSCGGGGGGGGGSVPFGFSGTGFGFSQIFGNTTGSGTSQEFPILNGVNLPIILYFNEPIDPDSVNANSISVTTIDVPDQLDPNNLVQQPGGIAASVDYIVNGANLYIKPTISFTKPEGEVVYGFLPLAAYEIQFTQPPSNNVVKSLSGKELILTKGETIAFITTEEVYDEWPGAPDPTFYSYDESNSKWNLLPEVEIQNSPEHLLERNLLELEIDGHLPNFRVIHLFLQYS